MVLRIGKFLAAMPTLALGMRCWRYAEWAGSEENWRWDSTCQDLEEGFSYRLALFSFFLSARILLKKSLFLDIFQWIEVEEKRHKPLHPSEDTTRLFDGAVIGADRDRSRSADGFAGRLVTNLAGGSEGV